MARREFLQLAKSYKPDDPKIKIAGWFVSEKLDGTRCFWDGGISRGLKTKDVPYASVIDPKTGNRKKKIKPRATGLWSRYGNPIMAPDWFLYQLPEQPLDGELWAGRGKFQHCRSICGGDTPDPRFDQIQYAAYGMPPIARLLLAGEIKNSNFHCNVDAKSLEWFESRTPAGYLSLVGGANFDDEYSWLCDTLMNRENVFAHDQIVLPDDEDKAREAAEEFLSNTLDAGGEGIVIRDPKGEWTPKRVNALLKYKPFDDAEGTVVGFTSGRRTDKGSKHLGRIGALILDYKGKRLELSGLTDKEREFLTEEDRHYANEHPGEDMPSDTQGRYFKLGQQVTFKYRELTDDGIPKEARYWRKRGVE
jgi:DNA ligase-1